MQRQKLSRRYVMRGAAGVSAAAILHWPANAAEFSYKLGSSSPMEHPAMSRQQSVDAVLHLLTVGGWLRGDEPPETRGPAGPGH